MLNKYKKLLRHWRPARIGLFKKFFLNRVRPSKSIQLESCSDYLFSIKIFLICLKTFHIQIRQKI